LGDVGRALRQWHDASESFDREGATWHDERCPTGEVICHNDFAPYNLVFRGGSLVGAIDFDTCSPGSRLWDLAYAAYRFVPLMPPRDADVDDGGGERSPFVPEEARLRLAAFLDAYAADDDAMRFAVPPLIDTVRQRLIVAAGWTERHARDTASSELAGHARMYRAHARWLGS
jgi:Ser/Thr protein kinase RdoA (MazF antagonist)